MVVTPEAALSCVGRAVAGFNASEEASVPTSPETILLGPQGAVDSLGLVRLLLEVEREIEREFGRAISLTDERAISQRNSPFRSVGTLADYIATILTEEP